MRQPDPNAGTLKQSRYPEFPGRDHEYPDHRTPIEKDRTANGVPSQSHVLRRQGDA